MKTRRLNKLVHRYWPTPFYVLSILMVIGRLLTISPESPIATTVFALKTTLVFALIALAGFNATKSRAPKKFLYGVFYGKCVMALLLLIAVAAVWYQFYIGEPYCWNAMLMAQPYLLMLVVVAGRTVSMQRALDGGRE